MLHQSYNPLLVLASMLIASLAGFAALDLSARVAAASGARRMRWVGASAVAMGVGIWSMHFTAMLALRLAVPVTYNVPLLALSLLIAISASAITFTGAAQERVDAKRLGIASLAMGPAIAGMHYTGMAAMRMPARIDYDSGLVTLSVAIAITASFAALLLARHFRRAVRHGVWLKVAAAIPMGAAVYGMHYTGMVAARFYPAPGSSDAADVIASEGLGWGIAVGAFIVLLSTLLAGFADRRLTAARARTHAILESALDCIITIDEDGRILEFNPAAEKVLGYSRTDVLGRELGGLIVPPAHREAHRAGLKRLRETGEERILGQRIELPALTADGREIDVELAITRIPGDPPVYTGFMRDITARKRSEEFLRRHTKELKRLTEAAETARAEAEEANRAKSEFLAAMSHELRTPLNAIAGYTQLLEEEIAGQVNEQQREYLSGIRRSQQVLLTLINDVLNFAKLEAGRVEFRDEKVDLDDVLRAAVSMVEPLAAKNNLDFRYDAPRNGVAVRADRDKVLQIVLNLVSNAVKFTGPGGRIALMTEDRDGQATISVADTGSGIPRDRLDDIFDPFVQVDRDAGRVAQGTGLGLAISRDLARAMGGDISVVSTVGAGSTFTVSLKKA